MVEQQLEEDFRQRLVPVWSEHAAEMRQRMAEQREPPAELPLMAATLNSKALDSEVNIVIVQRVMHFPFEV